MKRVAIALAAVLVLVVACATGPESLGQPTSGGPEAIATNLDVPWGIAFLPDGSALIAERDSGAIQHMAQPGVVNNVGAVAGVAARCGSPPATATVGAAPVTATTGFCSSGPEPAVSLCPALDDIGGGCGCVPKTDQ